MKKFSQKQAGILKLLRFKNGKRKDDLLDFFCDTCYCVLDCSNSVIVDDSNGI